MIKWIRDWFPLVRRSTMHRRLDEQLKIVRRSIEYWNASEQSRLEAEIRELTLARNVALQEANHFREEVQELHARIQKCDRARTHLETQLSRIREGKMQ